MSSVMARTGVVIGTGGAFDVKADKVGFRPSKVALNNLTRKTKAIWLDSMPDASAQLEIDSGAGTMDISTIATAGITPLATGFTIGNNADMNTSGDEIHFECWG